MNFDRLYQKAEHTLSSAKVAAVTDLPPSVLQDWNRRRVLSSREKSRDRYSPLEAAEIFFLRAVREANYAPLTKSIGHAKAAAQSILYFLLYDFESVRLEASISEQQEFLTFVKSDKFGECCKWLIGVKEKRPAWHEKNFSVWRGERWEQFNQPDEFLNHNLESEPVFSLTAISHFSLARLFAERFKGPLFTLVPRGTLKKR